METFANNGDEHNLEETELRLGLPGAIDSDSGGGQRSSGKRGFSDAMECRSSNKWAFSTALTPARVNELEACKPNQPGKFLASPTVQNMIQYHAPTWQAGSQDFSVQSSPYVSSRSSISQPSGLIGKCFKDELNKQQQPQDMNRPPTEPMKRSNESQTSSSDSDGMAPAPKAQVVGWPPIRSFRKNTLAANPKSDEDSEKAGGIWNGVYVKVSMDGAPYLRKVDLKMYSSYQDLSAALQNMFSCFTIGKYGCGRESLSESKLMDVVNGSEYVPTYEDKDGDWMLVGDVPWNMFVDSCKRLRIMKGSEAIGLAPRAMEKCKTRN